jgi:putrescine transport system substrate-binding protein
MRALFSKSALFAASLLITAGAQAQEEKVLNVYNWSDYVAPDTLKRFTDETGIKVNYDVYDSNETLEAKLLAGKSGYDVVFPSASPFLANHIKAKIYQKLDRTKLSNYANVEPAALKVLEVSDPGNAFALPYMTAPTGIGVNLDKVQKLMPNAPLDSWALLFDPKVTQILKACGISLLDAPDEVFPAVLAFTGKDPVSQDKKEIDEVSSVLNKVRASFKYIHSSSYINDLANGDLCVAHGYGGDLVQARNRAADAKNNVKIKVILPKEGANMVTDVMAIPADAPHPDNAHKFINFLLRPDVIGPITNAVGYANSVKGSDKFIKPEILNDPAIYPPEAVRAKLFVPPVPPQDYVRTRTRAWTKFKTKY